MFDEQREEAIYLRAAVGLESSEPDTQWAINGWPAVNGIAHLYYFPTVEKLGEMPDRKYMATKYEDELGERLHEMYMGEWTEDMGSVDELGWYGKCDIGWPELLEMGWIFFEKGYDGGWRRENNGVMPFPIGAILSCDDRGFCYYNLFFREAEYNEAWKQLQNSYSEWYDAQEALEKEEEEETM